jgi:ketosteroid isomerase-like protein
MKTVLSLFFLLAVTAQLSLGAGKADIKKALEANDKEFVKAFNAKDVAGMMAHYWKSPELAVFWPDTEYTGYDALEKGVQNMFNQMVDVQFGISDAHVTVVSNSLAYDWGHYSFNFTPKGAPGMIKLKGRFSAVWEKKDGNWVLTVDHASVAIPAPPQPVEPGGMIK